MQPRVGESCRSATLQLVLPSKPLAEPMPRVAVNGSVGRAHRSQTEVVRPSQKLPVQFRYSVLDRRPQPSAAGQLVDLGLEAVDLLRRRRRPDGRATRPRRVTQPNRVTQEVHTLLRHAAQARLGLVHRQPQLRHHQSHHPHRFVGGAAATDHEIIGIVDDVSVKAFLVPQCLPTQNEPTHINIRQQWREWRPLRAAPSLVLVAGRPMMPPPIVDCFHRRFEPHLDQLQEMPIADAPRDRFHQFGVRPTRDHRKRLATSAKTASPKGWPWRSLICLKWSMSSIIIPRGRRST